MHIPTTRLGNGIKSFYTATLEQTMRYRFADIQARPFPTVADIDNPYIFGSAEIVINVSERRDEILEEIMAERGITLYHCPLKEHVPDMGWRNLTEAVDIILGAIKDHKSVIVHCIGGNNRSRTVVEAAYFALCNRHYEDEYHGHFNHLVHNIEMRHLPLSRLEIEQALTGLSKREVAVG